MAALHVNPASRRARVWASRLCCLQASLKRDPTHRQAARWRQQIKVLSYLLARYGEDPGLDWEPQIAGALSRLEPALFNDIFDDLEALLDEIEKLLMEDLGEPEAKPPRSGAMMRPLLEHIVDANRDRYSRQENDASNRSPDDSYETATGQVVFNRRF